MTGPSAGEFPRYDRYRDRQVKQQAQQQDIGIPGPATSRLGTQERQRVCFIRFDETNGNGQQDDNATGETFNHRS